jgi:predicted  nucleic acid-binding Zn-ribbon protein
MHKQLESQVKELQNEVSFLQKRLLSANTKIQWQHQPPKREERQAEDSSINPYEIALSTIRKPTLETYAHQDDLLSEFYHRNRYFETGLVARDTAIALSPL